MHSLLAKEIVGIINKNKCINSASVFVSSGRVTNFSLVLSARTERFFINITMLSGFGSALEKQLLYTWGAIYESSFVLHSAYRQLIRVSVN